MDFPFDIDKAAAAAGYVTKRVGGKISGFLLLKILYGAERSALAKWQRPITGDSFVSMKKGPVLSRTYDLIKGNVLSTNSDMQKWSKHFSPRIGHNIELREPASLECLSPREIEVLEESVKEISALIKAKGLIADVLHEKWPEWKNPAEFGKAAIPLTVEDVLSEVLEDETEVERAALEIRSVASAKAALQVSR